MENQYQRCQGYFEEKNINEMYEMSSYVFATNLRPEARGVQQEVKDYEEFCSSSGNFEEVQGTLWNFSELRRSTKNFVEVQ